MIWVYDEAICRDLERSISPTGGAAGSIKVMDKGGILSLIAQIQQDKVTFPIIYLVRHDDTPIDTTRVNFTAMKRGSAVVYDTEGHNLYLEKVIPVKLEYDLVVLATNTVDMDEVMRELLFKYSSMYFLTTEVPYESKRTIRFGVSIPSDSSIQRNSGSFEYLQNGTLYESIIPLRCEGAVLVSYTPKHLERHNMADTIVAVTQPNENL